MTHTAVNFTFNGTRKGLRLVQHKAITCNNADLLPAGTQYHKMYMHQDILVV